MIMAALAASVAAACKPTAAPPRRDDGSVPRTPLNPPTGDVAVAFTERFIAYAQRAEPGAKLERSGELAVAVAGAEQTPLELASLWHECSTAPEACDAAMARWTRVLLHADAAAPQLETLRVAVFTLDFIRTKHVVARPFVGPLAQVLVVDSLDTISAVTPEQLAVANISAEVAWQRALDNLGHLSPTAITGHSFDPRGRPFRSGTTATRSPPRGSCFTMRGSSSGRRASSSSPRPHAMR